MNTAAWGLVDRAGRILGALVVSALAVLLSLGAAWFISWFSDDSAARGLAAMVDVWPIWLLAVAVIALLAVFLARVIRRGAVALMLGAIVGLIITMAGLAMLATGQTAPGPSGISS
jgi:ABC-type transport system involved in multi-copper enzyme maturation permease subunit